MPRARLLRATYPAGPRPAPPLLPPPSSHRQRRQRAAAMLGASSVPSLVELPAAGPKAESRMRPSTTFPGPESRAGRPFSRWTPEGDEPLGGRQRALTADDPVTQPGYGWEREMATPGRTLPEICFASFPNLNINSNRYVKYVDKNVLNYDSEGIMGCLGVFVAAAARGSVIRTATLRRAAVLTWLVAGALLALLLLLGVDVQSEDVENVKAMITDFHNLCSFLLGFFLSTCYARWWAIRAEGIGGLWGALDDIIMIVGALFPQDSEEDRAVRERVLRWGVLSHELMYKQIRSEDDFQDLVDKGLLLQEEAAIIGPLSSRPQCVWAWMCSYMAHLAYGEAAHGGSRMPHAVTMFPKLLDFCCAARDSIGKLFTYTDSQVPFRYVHILSLIVWVHNMVQALASAVRFAFECQNNHHWVSGVLSEMVFLMFYPVVYTSLLHVGVGMLNPVRSASDVDFPQAAYTSYMLAENRSFIRSCAPPAGPPYCPGRPPVWNHEQATSFATKPSRVPA
ncbi:unnamed protein product [Prorocentrum cordatum]|uniref:Bestrophin homolog n=1 Tax=Prorocentrum cordatum TaxID=2364126 RepID=A0ABN9RVR5_9DINO|nr:unnamed protein product [Polarella glacialis]